MHVYPYDRIPDGGGGFLPVEPGTVPHTVIEVDDLDPGVSFITLWRDDGTSWVRVRGAVLAPVVGAWSGVDWECGFNRVTAYRVELHDAAGTSLGYGDQATVTVDSEWTWIHSHLAPRDGVRVQATDKAMAELDRPYDADLVYARGRPYGVVVGSGRRGLSGMSFEVITESLEQADKVQALLGTPESPLPPVLCIRKGRNELHARIPPTLHLYVPSIVEVGLSIRWGGEVAVQAMSGSQAEPPAPALGVPLLTRADLSAAYATRAARSADNISRAAASRRWDLAGRASI